MAVKDTDLKKLKPADKPHRVALGRGLFLEVLPSGRKVWRLRYRLKGKQEKVTLGEYPAFSLDEALLWREECKAQVAKGLSPMKLKQQAKLQETTANTVDEFAQRWLTDIVDKTNKNPRNIKRVLEKDVLPAIGRQRISDVSVSDVLQITDKIKARGSDQSALLARNVMKRMFAYAISRELTHTNPAAAIEARFIAQAKSRDVALSAKEIGRLLQGIYTSNMKRSHKLALHLLLLCMVRKSELIEATWDEFDFTKAEWCIPAERMKKAKPHIVYLSRQCVAMFEELKTLACGSSYVLPSRSSLSKPISKSTLNTAIRSLDLDIREFVLHDFRRTASTHLHEAEFNSDWIEKALAHEQNGIRGVYNRAEYAGPRRKMLQWWADFVDQQIDSGSNVIIGIFGKEYRAS